MKVKPKGDYLLLEVKEYKDTGSIIMPEHLKKKKPIGTVISKGDYVSDDYNVNDVVIFQKQGTKNLPNTDLVLCPEHRILLKKQWLRESLELLKKHHETKNKGKQ
jgi:co-chaperonin GroES (HSP10)